MVQLSASTILANYQVEATGIPGPPGEDGKTSYFHIAYANSADGSLDFSTTESAGRSYIGTYTDFEILDSNDPTKYTWQLVKGADGENGTDGTDGKDGENGLTAVVHIAYANSADGTKDFSTSTATGRSYIGNYSDYEPIASTDSSKYTWQLVKGEQGDKGDQGEQGNDGIGITNTVITYQGSTSGTTPPQGTWLPNIPEVSAGNFLWTKTEWTYSDNSKNTVYSVAKMGNNGEDGKEMYFFQAWADNEDGSVGFSITDSTDKAYLGTYSSFDHTQSTNPADYKWTQLVGGLVIDPTNYIQEGRFNFRPVTVGSDRSYYIIPLTKTIPAGTKVQFGAEFYHWLANTPTPQELGVRIIARALDGTNAGIETVIKPNVLTQSYGEITAGGTLEKDCNAIILYNNSPADNPTNTGRYQWQNIRFNVSDKLSGFFSNQSDTPQSTQLIHNGTFQLGGTYWNYDVNRVEMLPASTIMKPTSNIAHLKYLTTGSTLYLSQTNEIGKMNKFGANQAIVLSFDHKTTPDNRDAGQILQVNVRNINTGAIIRQHAFSKADAYKLDITDLGYGWKRYTFRFVTLEECYFTLHFPISANATVTDAYVREIMCTTGGGLQGSYQWHEDDYKEIAVAEAEGVIPKVFVQSMTPTNVKDGDQWWKMSNNQVTNFYVWGNGQWNEQTIEQTVLNIQTLNAVNINGSIISGSEFFNSWEIDTPATEANPYPSKDIGFTKLADGKLVQENTHSMKLVDDYINTNKETTTLEKGVLINRAQGWGPSGDFGFNREARYDNAGLEFRDYSEVGTPISTVRLLPTEGLWVSNVLEGGTAGVLPTGPYYSPSAINHTSGDTPFVVTYGTGASLQNDTGAIRRISFGGNPSYGWGTDPNNSPIEIVYPTNNYLFRITRNCKLYIQYGLRIQGNGASNGADYVYSGFSWGSSIDATNTDANSHVLMWGADTGDSSLNLQNAGTGAGYYAFTAGTYLSVVRSIRSGRTLMNCTGLFIRFEEMYN